MWSSLPRFSNVGRASIPQSLAIPPIGRSRECCFRGQTSVPGPARRTFHDYFITHIPSSSLHPDARAASGPHHKLPRDKSTPHELQATNRSPASVVGTAREMTVVRIPLKSAKHHFGVSLSRGSRPYNEDSYQAGTIDVPAFAKRQPVSLQRSRFPGAKRAAPPDTSASGEPQVFYFGVFDGHGGNECSAFLREQLHDYVEEATKSFELESTLTNATSSSSTTSSITDTPSARTETTDLEMLADTRDQAEKTTSRPSSQQDSKQTRPCSEGEPPPLLHQPSSKQSKNVRKAKELEATLVKQWRELVGGYFRRFKPEWFTSVAGEKGGLHGGPSDSTHATLSDTRASSESAAVGIETVLEYAYLKADYDFVAAQVSKQDEDLVLTDRAINDDDILGHPARSSKHIGGSKRFKGGSTCSVVLISTPTASPFWHPSSPSSLITAHVGDTRVLLCDTATGQAVPLTSNHHPSHPQEATRLRRYAATFVTDSFGEERISGLANTRAFGDMASKRVGVSAEPEIRRLELQPAEYSFLVLVSDGVSGHLSDQEIVDVVKEAKTPEQAARELTSFATEVATDADNATSLVVRLGGWERRSEGGMGSMGTKEMRDYRRTEALDPRRGLR